LTQPEMPGGSQPGHKASVWQSLLVLPALGSLGLGVLLPLWLLAATFSTFLSVAWCAERLERLGVHGQESLNVASIISTVLILGGLGAASWVRLQEALRDGAEARARGAARGWLLRHPWWTLGLVLVAIDVLLVHEPTRRPISAATVVLAEGSWLFLTATWLAWRAAWGSLRWGWRLSRASSFLAGLVVAAGLFTASGWFLLIRDAEELARSARPTLRQALEQPRGTGSWDFSSLGTRFPARAQPSVVPALFERQQHGALLTPSVQFANPGIFGEARSESELLAEEPVDGFSDCVLGLDPQLRREATSLAGRYLDSIEAQDVVQDVLLRVCLHGRPPAVARGYFIRSVENRALQWRRRAARVCSLIEAPESGCSLHPEEGYLREEQSRAVNKALCALSEDDQEVLRLRFFEGEEYGALARRLSVTESTARQRVSRALKRLRAALGEKCL
jgi:RNA polymerase sigma factor (sigma-70 family)